jgi:hypothetical protein
MAAKKPIEASPGCDKLAGGSLRVLTKRGRSLKQSPSCQSRITPPRAATKPIMLEYSDARYRKTESVGQMLNQIAIQQQAARQSDSTRQRVIERAGKRGFTSSDG